MPHLPGIITGIQTSVTSVNLKQHKTLKLKNKNKTKTKLLITEQGWKKTRPGGYGLATCG